MTAGTGVDVKICGIRTPDDYDACHAAGAAFVGMVFFPRSPRHLSMGEARTLADHADRAGGGPSRVALTVDMDDAGLEDVVATARPHLTQLHGNETPERAAEIGKVADAVVVGSAIVEELATKGVDQALHLAGTLADAAHSAR